jgi:hypothetical protein
MDLNNTLSFCIKLAVAFLILQFFYCNSNDMQLDCIVLIDFTAMIKD